MDIYEDYYESVNSWKTALESSMFNTSGIAKLNLMNPVFVMRYSVFVSINWEFTEPWKQDQSVTMGSLLDDSDKQCCILHLKWAVTPCPSILEPGKKKKKKT